MAPKRPLEEDTSSSKAKKHRTGFNVGPENLPDGTWRRKVIKIKHDLVHKAKVKKEYAKIKARELPEPATSIPIPASVREEQISKSTISGEAAQDAPEPSTELHPSRQAMLDGPATDDTSNPNPYPEHLRTADRQARDRRKNQRPAYFNKELSFADKKKREADERQAEFERRNQERKEKLDERDKFRRAMAKARVGGKNGQRKLGRESVLLLEKVKRTIG